MKLLYQIIRFFVGVIFILSGLIKTNDLIGFSFKIEEYFSPSVLSLSWLSSHSLTLSFLICLSEVVLGLFLICGWKKRFTFTALFSLEIFFAFLTFYSAYYNKVTDCGCFGDAIKFTPWESFFKDIFLLSLTFILFVKRKYLSSFPKIISKIIIFIGFISTSLLGYYTYHHLPLIDFRPYKVGVNIEEQMSYPKDAPLPTFEYLWTFKKDGKSYTVKTQGDYPQTDGEFVSVETHQITAGYTPPIHDFTIEDEGEDLAQSFLQTSKLVMIVAYNIDNSDLSAFANIREFAQRAQNNGYTVIGLTASSDRDFIKKFQLPFSFYFCDETALKTMIRSNPGVLILEKGKIIKKLHYNDVLSFNF